jgi:hypothetical protein
VIRHAKGSPDDNGYNCLVNNRAAARVPVWWVRHHGIWPCLGNGDGNGDGDGSGSGSAAFRDYQWRNFVSYTAAHPLTGVFVMVMQALLAGRRLAASVTPTHIGEINLVHAMLAGAAHMKLADFGKPV